MNIIASNRPFPNRDIVNPNELKSLLLEEKPEYIFFPYWSWKVPQNITNEYKCIGFHTGDIKGGSPIQNLIRCGVEKTHIRMFHLTDKIDDGQVICTADISLLGSLEEIILRQTDIMKGMIDGFIQTNFG